MTIKRARELLDTEIENLKDEEVQHMIDRDFRLCDALLDVIMNTTETMLTNNERKN